jgi:hypothetical protein
MILKIQRPLYSSENSSFDDQALFYNKSRTRIFTMDWDYIKCLFVQDELKIYVKASIDKDNKIRIYKILNPALSKCQF